LGFPEENQIYKDCILYKFCDFDVEIRKEPDKYVVLCFETGMRYEVPRDNVTQLFLLLRALGVEM
jgi:hypothetical protein